MSLATPVKGRHPRALYVLFLTEMWERFAYYLLAGILLLYLRNGKQFTPDKAADITGSFLALIWLPLFIGGMIADRYLGYIKSIFIGGSLLAAGFLGLGFPRGKGLFFFLGGV